MRRGLPNRRIAERLGISIDGVKFHVSNMLGKLGLRNRRELAAWQDPGGYSMAKEEQAKLLEMSIDSIRVNLATYQRAVVLRVKETKRYLPVWIGPSEADSIAMKLRNITLPRPMTHDLLHSIIVEDLDTSVTRVIVSRLEQTTFYAQIVLQRNGTTIERDCPAERWDSPGRTYRVADLRQ